MTTVWRIGYCPQPLPDPKKILLDQAEGSTLFDGRWHTRSTQRIVYAACNRALCQLEKRVHSNGLNLKNQILMRLDLPTDASLLTLDESTLPADWTRQRELTQSIGNAWLNSGDSLGLWVPSAIEPFEQNLLINPAHPGYIQIALTVERDPFMFDPRLFNR